MYLAEAITRIEKSLGAEEEKSVRSMSLLCPEGEFVRFGRVRYPVLGGLGARDEEEDIDVVRVQTNRSVMARCDVATQSGRA